MWSFVSIWFMTRIGLKCVIEEALRHSWVPNRCWEYWSLLLLPPSPCKFTHPKWNVRQDCNLAYKLGKNTHSDQNIGLPSVPVSPVLKLILRYPMVPISSTQKWFDYALHRNEVPFIVMKSLILDYLFHQKNTLKISDIALNSIWTPYSWCIDAYLICLSPPKPNKT